MIPQRNISLLSNRLAVGGGRRIPEQVLERDYCIAWFLVGLSQVPLRRHLIFKGGTALKRCYFNDYRFSEDLDFTLAGVLPLDEILNGLEPVYTLVRQESGIDIRFSKPDRRQHQNTHTFYIAYQGPLPTAVSREVKVDITISEQIVCPLGNQHVIKGHEEYTDLPEHHSLQVYSLEEIAIEKLVAVTDRARNEPRDLYDLWYLTSMGHVDLNVLHPEVDQKLTFRGRNRADLRDNLALKESRLDRLWNTRLAAQMVELPPFNDVYRAVNRTLRTSGLL